jgi:hypothetical protein
MRTIRILTLVLTTTVLAATIFTTQASACPGGYVACGSACCPGR